MKKAVVLVLIFAILLSFVSCSGQSSTGTPPSNSKNTVQNPLDNITLKLKDTATARDCSIKFSYDENMSASYYITPEGFEWDKLEKKGYKMEITVTYDVYYKKDWDLGFGYAGSPRYEISVVNSDGMGKFDENMPTETTPQTRTLSFSSRIVDLKDTRLILTFSTDNVQNIIYFKNIKIDYRCYK